MPNTEHSTVNSTITSTAQSAVIHVAVGVIWKNNHILIAKRLEHVHQGGLWEFPGGKVEVQETVQQALKRELFEELAITSQSLRPLIQIPYQYDQKKVFLDVWHVLSFTGQEVGKEGQAIVWIKPDQLRDFQFPAANEPIARAIMLPQSYLITPANIQPNFLTELEEKLQAGIKLLQLRIKETVPQIFFQQFIALVKKYPVSVQINSNTWQHYLGQENQQLIHSEWESASQAGSQFGIHLTSHDLQQENFQQLPGLKSASCHHAQDIQAANQLGLDFLVLSPVLKTQTHPTQSHMGWDNFKQLSLLAQSPVYALGGMKKQYLEQAINCGAQGIAAITGLWSR